jgi:hypothetical protein
VARKDATPSVIEIAAAVEQIPLELPLVRMECLSLPPLGQATGGAPPLR